MSENENLEAKYGRKKNPPKEASSNFEQIFQKKIPYDDKSSNKYGKSNSYTKKTKEEFTQKQKDIQSNIANVLSQYSNNNTKTKQNNYDFKTGKEEKKKDSFIVSFIKSILILCIIVVFSCIGLSIFAKPYIDTEGEQIIRQLEKAEDIYFASVYKYHFFSKTKYDSTLGVDISSCKYFSSYEVKPNEKTGNYEIKLYGATNTFTMAYYFVKTLITK